MPPSAGGPFAGLGWSYSYDAGVRLASADSKADRWGFGYGLGDERTSEQRAEAGELTPFVTGANGRIAARDGVPTPTTSPATCRAPPVSTTPCRSWSRSGESRTIPSPVRPTSTPTCVTRWARSSAWWPRTRRPRTPRKPAAPVRYLYTPYGEAHAETGPELRRAHFENEVTTAGGVEQQVSNEHALAPLPGSLSFAEAAALPTAGFTALQALRDKGELAAGERVAINGASGGVGHLAVQITRAAGARVTGVASARNLDFLRELGAERDDARPGS